MADQDAGAHQLVPLVSNEEVREQVRRGGGVSAAAEGADDSDEDLEGDLVDETEPLMTSLGSFWHNGEEDETSLGEMYRSVNVHSSKSEGWWSKLYRFMGPGYLVAAGYMDPGNWATDLAGGSAYNYRLLFVIVLSSVIAMFLQALALRLGLVTRLDLAQACRARYSKTASFLLWIAAEIAIGACTHPAPYSFSDVSCGTSTGLTGMAGDLAEVIGSAVAIKLLFGLPLIAGVLITACDVIFVIYLGGKHIRVVEVIVFLLVVVIATCFAFELYWSPPDFLGILKGSFVPSHELITDPNILYIGIGILGATVMPHNLYLHSSLVQTRDVPRNASSVREAITMCLLDSNTALIGAFFINGAILILAASTFYKTGHKDVADLEQAYHMLDKVIGSDWSSILFAVALLASGQQSTLTGTIAGQIVMEGFVQWTLSPTVRRLVTRLAAIIPAVIVVLVAGDAAVNDLLVLSQVVLSLQLSFAIFPLVMFTSDPDIMGEFVNSKSTKFLAWGVAWFVLALNMVLIVQTIRGA